MYSFLKQFEEKDLTSYHFRTEMYYKIKEILIQVFQVDEKTYYNDVETYQKVEKLTQFMLDLYKLGISVANGKTFKDYEREDIEKEMAINRFIGSL